MASVFKGLIQNIPAIFYRCICDKNWTVRFINKAVQDMTGYPADDFIANKVRSFNSIIYPDDRQAVESSILTAIEKIPFGKSNTVL